MHSWFEGQGAWNGGLMQRRNVPKELILVDFQEVTTCPTCVEKSKHCVGSKCPGKQSSGVPYRPASASWALSKHVLTSQSEGPLPPTPATSAHLVLVSGTHSLASPLFPPFHLWNGTIALTHFGMLSFVLRCWQLHFLPWS